MATKIYVNDGTLGLSGNTLATVEEWNESILAPSELKPSDIVTLKEDGSLSSFILGEELNLQRLHVVVVQAGSFQSFEYENCMISVYSARCFYYPDHNQYVAFEGTVDECEKWRSAAINQKSLHPTI